MATRSRIRRFVLITGTLLSLLIAAAFVVSAWWVVMFPVPQPNGPGLVLIEAGAISVELIHSDIGLLLTLRKPTWNLSGWNAWTWSRQSRYIAVPLYAVFLAVAIPTLLVWRFVPKFPRGHCQRCGYNLTGNVSGTCPECGRALEA